MSKAVPKCDDTSPVMSGSWEDQITDSESEDVADASTKVTKSQTEEDLYLKILKEDGNMVDDFFNERKSNADGPSKARSETEEIITIDDNNFSEDEKVNQYLDDIERKLEENFKKKEKDDWKVVDYFQDIICVKDDGNSSRILAQNRGRRNGCKRRRPTHVSPCQSENNKKRKKQNKQNVSLSDGEIISDEELILSDVSLSPDLKHKFMRKRNDNHGEISRSSGNSRVRHESSEHSKRHSKNSRCDKHRGRSSNYDSSDHSPVHTSFHARHRAHHGDHRRRHSSPEQHWDTSKRRLTEKHKSKRHKTDTKHGEKNKSSSDYFDEEKYYGSDKSRIRNLKKKYDEYLKYARKFKNDDQDNDHIEKFVKMRSKLKGEDSNSSDEKHFITESSIDYKKEEEKFLRSLESYLQIKKKQEKSMSTGVESILSSKDYDPENISSEEEEYVPEKFTPENISVGPVEEYDPCSESNVSTPSITYNPTKIDEYEPVTLRVDEEYCPMPVKNLLLPTYNPTKKYGTNPPASSVFIGGTPRRSELGNGYIPFAGATKPSIPKPAVILQPHKVSKNTVFIGNIINPMGLNTNVNHLGPPSKPSNALPNHTSIDKSKIMSKLVNEKLLEIEKKKLKLLEEINRKKLLKIKEKCDEVELKNLEKKKTDLIQELEMNTNIECKTVGSPRTGYSIIEKQVMMDNGKQRSSGNLGDSSLSNTIRIKQEKAEAPHSISSNNFNVKLDALNKMKAELMLKINEKMTKNTDLVSKEKAEVSSRLQELEKNKLALLAQLEKKEAEKKDQSLLTVKIEKDISSNVITAASEIPTINKSELCIAQGNVINIKKERDDCQKPLLQGLDKSTSGIKITDQKTKPLINKKLSELELEKAKLMAEIAAKSNKGVILSANVKKEVGESTVDEKLNKLASERDLLRAEIDEKQNQTKYLTSMVTPTVKSNSNPSDLIVNIKKEKEDNSIIEKPKIKVKSDKDLKKEMNALDRESHEDLAAKIKQLEKEKAQLMQTLAKKVPPQRNSKLASEVVKSNHLLQKSPKAIKSFAGQVKQKVNQQLSEITKKKLELMKQIQSKSSNSSISIKREPISSPSTKTENVKEKLLELERSKLKLLIEINKKISSEKENIVKEMEDTKANEVQNISKSKELSDPKEDFREEDDSKIKSGHNDSIIIQSCPNDEKEVHVVRDDDEIFKVPAVPRLKKSIKGRGKLLKTKTIKPRMKMNKYQRTKIKSMLNKNKLSMIKKFRKLRELNALWVKSDDSGFSIKEDPSSCSRLEFTSGPVLSSEISNSMTNSSSAITEKVISKTTGPAYEETPNFNESSEDKNSKESATESNCDSVEQDKTDDERSNNTLYSEVEILELSPVPIKRELVTIDDNDGDNSDFQPSDNGKPINQLPENTETHSTEMMADDNEFITLKFIKVEKFNDADEGGNQDKDEYDEADRTDNEYDKSDEKNDRANQTYDENGKTDKNYDDLNQSQVRDQQNHEPPSDSNTRNDDTEIELVTPDSEKKTLTDNNDIFDVIDLFDTDEDLGLETNEAKLASVLTQLDKYTVDEIDDEIIIVEENGIHDDSQCFKSHDKQHTNKISIPRIYENNGLIRLTMPQSTNSLVVSRLILNNKKKLVSGQVKVDTKRDLLNSKSSKFKFVRSSALKTNSATKWLKCERDVAERNVERHPSTLRYSSNKLIKRKSSKGDGQIKRASKLLKREKYGKTPSVYKFEKKNSQFRLENWKYKSKNSKYKLELRGKSSILKCTNNRTTVNPSVISKFKLVRNKSNAKLVSYKTLPLPIRRHVRNSLGQNSQESLSPRPDRSETSKRKSLQRHSRSKYKISNAMESTSQSERNIISGGKSKYKLWRSSAENAARSKESRTATLRRYQVSPRCLVKPKLNHFISKYKMVRNSNQRERNKLNLSLRLQESSYPNRTMKVMKLHGASYKVSSRSLKRKLSSCLEPLNNKSVPARLPSSHTAQASPLIRKPSKVWQLRENIFSNRNMIGRTHLTSSRLRSLAVLTSRLRKNNVQQVAANPATSRLQVGGNRGGFHKGSIGSQLKSGRVDLVRVGNCADPNFSSRQMYRNLSYTSPSEILRHRRTSRHRSQARRKYSSLLISNSPQPPRYGSHTPEPPEYEPCRYPSETPDDTRTSRSEISDCSRDSVTVEGGARYFDNDNPRSNIRPDDEEVVETVIPKRVRRVGVLPGFIPL